MKESLPLRLVLTCAGLLTIGTLSAQNKNLGVGTPNPNPNAVLDIVSPTNNQGVLLPRLTTAQRTTLASALDADDKGLMLYDIDDNSIYTWDGTTWKNNDATVFPITKSVNSNASSFQITETNAANTAGVMSINTAGEGAAIIGENTNTNGGITTAHGVKGTAMAGGNNAGVYGTTLAGGTGVMAETSTGWSAVFGYQHNPTIGWAADFEIDAPTNSWASVFAHTHGTGPAGAFITYGGNDSTAIYAKTSGTGLAGYFERDNASGSQPALFVKSNGGFTGNSAAIIAESNGGYAGLVSKQKSGFGNALVAISESPEAGSWGLLAESTNGAAGVFMSAADVEPAVQITTTGDGGAMSVNNNGPGTGLIITNGPSSSNSSVAVTTNGTGDGIYSDISANSSTNAAIKGRAMNDGGTGGAFEIFGATNNHAAMYAFTNGTGSAGNFNINNGANSSAALTSNTAGTGVAFSAYTTTGWTAIQSTHGGSGNALHSENTGTGTAGFFAINNASNPSQALNVHTVGTGGALYIDSNNGSSNFPTVAIDNNGQGSSLEARASGTGNAITVNHTGVSGNLAVFRSNGSNVARIDKTGQGFFNGGTTNTGADVAEMFEVEGLKEQYEPGDVLVISETSDRTVEKSASAVSYRVAGVYATKPGLRLTEETEEGAIDALVPMGVVGVIPTKVCIENGPIKRGDLLVTSSKAGHAMKATPVNINGVLIYPTGAILGKALENFEGQESGLIKVLVNVK